MLSFNEIRSALQNDDVVQIEKALDDGLSPSLWLDLDSRESLLAVAILADSLKCAELLLERGGDWTASAPPDEDQISPLALAIKEGSPEMVQIFARLGLVESYAVDWLEDVAAELLVRPTEDESMVEILERLVARPEGITEAIPQSSLREGIEKKARNRSRECADPVLAGRWAAIGQTFESLGRDLADLLDQVESLAANGHTTRLRRVLEDLPPEARREGAGRALVYATKLEDWALAEEMFEIGVDCSLRVGGRTALMEAAMRGNLSLVRKFIAAGADPAAKEDGAYGRTVIEMAGSRLVELYLRKQLAKTGE